MNTNFDLAFLRAKGYRVTPQRIAIMEILTTARNHLLPAEIFRQAEIKIPGINEATVYRTLDFLANEGVIHRSMIDSNQVIYEMAPKHHHLICRDCGQEIEINHTIIEEMYANIEKITGYCLDSGHLIIYGLCPVCKPKSKP